MSQKEVQEVLVTTKTPYQIAALRRARKYTEARLEKGFNGLLEQVSPEMVGQTKRYLSDELARQLNEGYKFMICQSKRD